MAAVEARYQSPKVLSIDHYSKTTAALNADIQSFTTSKGMVEDANVKTAFESVIVILTLVRVRFSLNSYYFVRLQYGRTGTS
jgi:hypothetical protein